MPRFVVLYHECPGDRPRPSHWDFMLEADSTLRTWALSSAPNELTEQLANELPHHRTAYLDYEGPVSGNRGHVTRWDSGTFYVLTCEGETLTIELLGQRLRGVATLKRDADDAQRWRFSFAPTSR